MTSYKPPNLESAIESNVPVISGIIIGVMAAIFAATAVTQSTVLTDSLSIHFWPGDTRWVIDVAFERRTWIMSFSLFAITILYVAALECVRSKGYDYKSAGTDLDMRTNEDKERVGKWEAEREKLVHASIKKFNIGILFSVASLICFLPDKLFVVGFFLLIALVVWLLLKQIRE